MYKPFLTYLLLTFMITMGSQAQSSLPGYTYHPAQQDKASWQRLNLWMSSTYLNIVKEGQADQDSSLYVASRSLGLSRYSILAEGIDDPALATRSQWIDQHDPNTGRHMLAAAKGIQHLELLMLLGAYYAFEPHAYYRHRDSVNYYLYQAINESKVQHDRRLGRHALCLLGKMYIQAGDPLADSIYKAVIDQSRQAGDTSTAARIMAYRGIYTPPSATTILQKIKDLQQAADAYLSLQDKENAINVLTDLGYLQIIMQDPDAAYNNFLKAYHLAESIHYPYTHYSTQALTTVTTFQGKFGEPLKYTYQTIKTAEATRDSLALAYFYTSLALLYDAEGREKENYEMAQKSVARFVADRNTSVYGILNDVVEYMILHGQGKEALALTRDISNKVGLPLTYGDQFFYHYLFATAYIHLDSLDQAEFHIKKMDTAETRASAIRGTARRSTVVAKYGFLLTKRKQYQQARALFEENIAAPSFADGSIATRLNIYQQLIYIDSVLGDSHAGITHYREYVKLIDSNFMITKIRQSEELQVTYQIQEKENQITTLTQQAKLEKANSEKAALLRNITIVGIGAIMIIAVLLYRQNRLKQKSNEVITQKNGALQELLTEKEWLVKEIHHRVKNNLQVIMSLLDSQAEYINNEAALNAVQDNLRRVHAMALIHQKLYLTDNISSIDMQVYINELLNYAQDSFDDGDKVRFEQHITPLDLDVSQAIPLGLIINECIVNALKYAFPDGRRGIIQVGLDLDETDHIILHIADNGKGLPPDLDLHTHRSLGLDLIRGLTRQLEGSVHMENKNGLHITIRFAFLTFQFAE